MIIFFFFGSDTSNSKLCGQFDRISYKGSCEPCNSNVKSPPIPYLAHTWWGGGGGGGGAGRGRNSIISA